MRADKVAVTIGFPCEERAMWGGPGWGVATGAGAMPGPQAGLQARIETPAQTGLNMDLLIEAFGDGSVRQGAVMQDFHFNASSFDLAFDVLPGDGSVHKHAWHGQVAAGGDLACG